MDEETHKKLLLPPNATPPIESPSSMSAPLSFKGFLLSAYKSIALNAHAHRITRSLLVSYILAFVIIPPLIITLSFFTFPLQTARFFNFQVQEAPYISKGPGKSEGQVLAATTSKNAGDIIASYIAAALEPQAAASVKALRILSPGTVAGTVLPPEVVETIVATGLTGPAGPIGLTGAAGAAGASGTQGSQGDKGDKGDKGDTGATGSSGSTYLSSTGGLIDNSGISLLTTCSDGQVLAWNNGTSTWECTSVTTLPNVGTAGTYGNSTTIPVFTTDAQGRVTGVTPTTISGLSLSNFSSANISQWTNNANYISDGNTGWDNSYGFISASSAESLSNKTISGLSNTITNIGNGSLTNSSLTINTNSSLSGGGLVSLGGMIALSLSATGSAGLYGGALSIPVFTTDSYGRITAVTPTSISGLTASNLAAGDFSSAINTGIYSINISGNSATASSSFNASFLNGNTFANPGVIGGGTASSGTFTGLTISGLSSNSALYTNGTSGLSTTAPTTGTIDFWNRTGTTISPGTSGDAINGTGAITSAGLLTASNGLTVTSGSVSLPVGSISTAALAHSSLSLAGNTGTGSASLGGSLTFTGTGGTSASVSGNVVTINTPTAGTLTIRGTDLGTTVNPASVVEFGPVSTSSDEFIISDQTGGVARIRLGNKVLLTDNTATMSGKTISALNNTISGLTTSNLSNSAGITNSQLANSSLTITAGTGLSGGGTISLGGIATLSANLTTSGTTGSTASNSGLEVSAAGLTLLKGCADNQILKYTDGGGWACSADSTGGSPSFDLLTSGTNTIASMTIGTGGSLTFTGTGTINASTLNGNTFANPGAIGSGTAGTGTFSGLTVSSGALSLTSTSGSINSTGLTGLTQTLSSGTAAITAPTINLNSSASGNTSIGNSSGTFALTSNGGLNITTGGALTGVTSIDTISTSGTALTFAAGGSLSSTGANALSLDGGSTGVLNINNNSTGNILIGGGSGSTGCTITNSTGALACTAGIAGSNLSGSSSGTNTGDITLGAIGSTPNANGASLSSQALNLQPADGTFGGVVSTTTQTFAGAKTFSGTLTITSLIRGSDTITDFTGSGLTVAGNALTLSIPSATDALSTTTSSGSGLEVLTAGLTMLQGCSDGQILKWNETTDVWACAADSGGSITLQLAYDSGNAITTTTGRNIAFTLGEVATPTSLTLENQDTAGASAQRIFNSIASGTLTNGLLIEQTGAGTMTNGIQIAETAGTISDGILITGTLGNIINSNTLDISGAGAITGATGVTLTSGNITTPGNITTSGTGDITSASNIITSSEGIEFTESDTNPTCASGDYRIYADTSEAKIKKCVNGVVSDVQAIQDVIYASDATNTTWADSNTTTLWNGTALSITPTSTAQEVLVMVSLRASGDMGNNEAVPVARVDRETTTASCDDVNTVGPTFGANMNDNANGDASQVVTLNTVFVDAPSSTSTQSYIVCTSADSAGSSIGNVTENSIDMTLMLVNDAGDLAEIYPTNDMNVAQGDVVSIDSSLINGVKKSSGRSDKNVLGVVATKPALVIGNKGATGISGVPVALAGRVPVKVSIENGPITPGDVLVAGSVPGTAMRGTKAGAMIGIALEQYDKLEIGSAMIFVKTGYYTGSNLKELLTSETKEEINTNGIGKLALSKLVSGKDQLTQAVDLSEIYTDRIIAGLEIITPKITTQDILALGNFSMQDKEGNTNVSIDSLGNATFSGLIIADSIRANRIEGLDIIANKLRSLSERMEGEATSAALMSVAPTPETNILNLISKSVSDIFKNTAEFFGKAIFNNDVSFLGRPTFNKDTAGHAFIKQGDSEVTIEFAKEYTNLPVVNVNVNLVGAVKSEEVPHYAVYDVTTKGFSIKLPGPSGLDLSFSWTALAVTDDSMSTSKQNAPSPLPAPSTPPIEVSPSIVPTAQPSNIPTPTAEPTMIPTSEPSAVPTQAIP